MPILEVNHCSFAYGESLILDHIDFAMEEGEYLALIGPNGGGKTTLLKLLLGLLPLQQGEIKLFGQTPAKACARGQIGYVPQLSHGGDFSFPANLLEVVASGLTRSRGLFRGWTAENQKQVDWALELTGLTHLKHHRIADLSGGERQRVFIARALAQRPKLLFLDEPVAGVDQGQQERFYQLLTDLNQNQKLSLIFVSHDVGVMARQASRFLCLNRRLVCHGQPEEFLKEDFLGQLYGKHLAPLTHHHH